MNKNENYEKLTEFLLNSDKMEDRANGAMIKILTRILGVVVTMFGFLTFLLIVILFDMAFPDVSSVFAKAIFFAALFMFVTVFISKFLKK
jgi:hypothetical protein